MNSLNPFAKQASQLELALLSTLWPDAHVEFKCLGFCGSRVALQWNSAPLMNVQRSQQVVLVRWARHYDGTNIGPEVSTADLPAAVLAECHATVDCEAWVVVER
jgi:hypothetical protein